jgi:hypothetical protein
MIVVDCGHTFKAQATPVGTNQAERQFSLLESHAKGLSASLYVVMYTVYLHKILKPHAMVLLHDAHSDLPFDCTSEVVP